MAVNRIDPWGSVLVEDYERIIEQFGLEHFDQKIFPDPNRLMRRGIVFAGRDLQRIATCIEEKKPYYVLTGFMPTNDHLHFGNKMVVEMVRYFQDHGAHTYILVADLEASAVRKVSLEEARKRALSFHIPAYIALGLDPAKTTFYFQSQNRDVVQLAFTFAQKITLAEFKAIYGKADPSRIMSALTQSGDILYPQLKERMPGIIPVGVDQDPHIRLTRDIVRRTKETKFFLPSAIMCKYTPSLQGDLKMSSKPESCIELPEDDAIVKKIMRAISGGRSTLEEHRRLGGEPEKCMVFELLKQHLIESDDELQKIYDEYKSGRMTAGEIKQLAARKMTAFMEKMREDMKKAASLKLNFISFKT